MEYLCVDRGSDKCPCVLMEAGQCYSCNMIQKGKCDCSSLWQGVCPYSEYLQRNKRTVGENKPRKYKITHIKSYSPTLSVITFETPLAYGIKCKEMGTFVMAGWKDWFIPLSVIDVKEDFENQISYVSLGINATGPKTIGLLKKSMIGDELVIKGPFYSGIINREIFDKSSMSIILAKGIAVMPIINMKNYLKLNLLSFRLDTQKLPEEFLEDYLSEIEYEKIDLEKDTFEVAETLKEECGYSYNGDKKTNVFLMVSPYYVERLLKLTSFAKKRVMIPNHSNMCCGEGVCGSCSYSDKDGITVRPCKCIDA